MPRIKDKRLIAARKKRQDKIRKRFDELFNQGLRYEIVMNTLIEESGYSESTINQIVKQYGNYKK